MTPALGTLVAMPETATAPSLRLTVTDPGRIPVSVSVSPLLSVLCLLLDSHGGGRAGAPARWLEQVRAASGAHAAAALHPMAHPAGVSPDCVVPLPPTADSTIPAQLDALRDTGADTVTEQLGDLYGDDLPPWWRPVAGQPRRWLDAYLRAVTDTWTAIGPLWRRTRPLVDREIERAGIAVVRGGVDALLNSISPRLSYQDGEVRVRAGRGGTVALGDRRLVLVPMLAGPNGLVCSLDHPEVAYLGYPLRDSAGRPAGPPARSDALREVVGPHRAVILTSLDRPASMRQLTAMTGIAANTTTYHCDRLVAAGLVSRHRAGREIRISRTSRGTELLDLLMP